MRSFGINHIAHSFSMLLLDQEGEWDRTLPSVCRQLCCGNTLEDCGFLAAFVELRIRLKLLLHSQACLVLRQMLLVLYPSLEQAFVHDCANRSNPEVGPE